MNITKHLVKIMIGLAISAFLMGGCGKSEDGTARRKRHNTTDEENSSKDNKREKDRKSRVNDPGGNTILFHGKYFDITKMTYGDLKELTDAEHIQLPNYTKDSVLEPYTCMEFVMTLPESRLHLEGTICNLTGETISILDGRVTQMKELFIEGMMGVDLSANIPAEEIDPLLQKLVANGWTITRDYTDVHAKEEYRPRLFVEGVSQYHFWPLSDDFKRNEAQRIQDMGLDGSYWLKPKYSDIERHISAEMIDDELGLCEMVCNSNFIKYEFRDVDNYLDNGYWPAQDALVPSVLTPDKSALEIITNEDEKEQLKELEELLKTGVIKMGSDEVSVPLCPLDMYSYDESAVNYFLNSTDIITVEEGYIFDASKFLASYYGLNEEYPLLCSNIDHRKLYWLAGKETGYPIGTIYQGNGDGRKLPVPLGRHFNTNCELLGDNPERIEKGVWRWKIGDTGYDLVVLYGASGLTGQKPNYGGSDICAIIRRP
ncbi:hypothetical protein [Oribacterium sp. FC2011]|uniref:hypothetical protein n=1 Tax=Oribacterium sp. FC2011 TaxID=1408311 RepID=UPI0004E0EB8C|nr:hypothetical protein [Oribacterium sp. FC2011]